MPAAAAANERTHFSSNNGDDDGGGEVIREEYSMFWMDTMEHVGAHWKSFLLVGSSNVIMGLGCLLFPVFATQVTELVLISLVFVAGLVTILGVLWSNNSSSSSNSNSSNTTTAPQRSALFWMGICQILLALLMYWNPFVTLTVLTFVIAITFMLLGSMQIAVARQYREQMAASTLMMFSGTAAILMSVIICLSLPTAKWYTIGVLMGVNLINIGMNRIVLGLYGRKIESNDASVDSWRVYLDADLV